MSPIITINIQCSAAGWPRRSPSVTNSHDNGGCGGTCLCCVAARAKRVSKHVQGLCSGAAITCPTFIPHFAAAAEKEESFSKNFIFGAFFYPKTVGEGYPEWILLLPMGCAEATLQRDFLILFFPSRRIFFLLTECGHTPLPFPSPGPPEEKDAGAAKGVFLSFGIKVSPGELLE